MENFEVLFGNEGRCVVKLDVDNQHVILVETGVGAPSVMNAIDEIIPQVEGMGRIPFEVNEWRLESPVGHGLNPREAVVDRIMLDDNDIRFQRIG